MSDWEFWIDVGGTFTDCLARRPDGKVVTYKLLSSGVVQGELAAGSNQTELAVADRADDPDGFFDGYRVLVKAPGSEVPEERTIRQFDRAAGRLALDRPLPFSPEAGARYEIRSDEEAPIVGIRWLTAKRRSEEIGPVSVRLGTTRGTNALLERQGAPTGLVTTQGFGDVLKIAFQNRPKLFDLRIRTPSQLYRDVAEISERRDHNGAVLTPLNVDEVRRKLATVKGDGCTSLAVCLLNSYRDGSSEETVEAIARDLGFDHVSLSSRLTPVQRIVPRGDTTVVDAYLTPIIRDYVSHMRTKLPNAGLKLMTSAGGLTEAERFIGKDSILSGPAGGVVGVAKVAGAAGFEKAIGFDMGGTSTDVSRFDGEFERRYVMEVNDAESDTGVRIVAPMLSIETVAAGGGSICWFDGQKTVVGPRSAGSDPGPACYGRGGPLTVTDVNLYLGRILPKHFAFPLDEQAVTSRLDEVRAQIDQATGQQISREELAVGFVKIANVNMSAAVKKVSVAKGYDVRDHVLVSFGGAGGQHACAMARDLGIGKILQHPFAGILSAYGIGQADVRRFGERFVGKEYSESTLDAMTGVFAELEADLRKQVQAEGVAPDRIRVRCLLDLRYQGQETAITIARPDDGDFADAFVVQHRQLYGFDLPDRGLEICVARVEAVGATGDHEMPVQPTRLDRPEAEESSHGWFGDRWQPTAVFHREKLHPGDVIEGPAIVIESTSTIVVDPGWQAELTGRGDLLLTDLAGAARVELSAEVDPITLELFNNQFVSIAEQMGATLQKTSLSTNVKERLDFSCALFTAQGDLVVNAPHIPVHLGAMSQTVKELIATTPSMKPGDAFVTNDPYRGGSHLPDVTVVTPMFADSGEVLFFAGSRAHHAEIGGIVPGSMPPYSKSLAEEGVLIRAFRLVQNNQSSENELRALLSGAPYPSRAVEENIADVNAQVAANQTGVHLLRQLVDRYSLDTVRAYMGHIQQAAENKMRAALHGLAEGTHTYRDSLDDGSQIAVAVTIRHTGAGGEAVVDFAGTGPVSAGNLNANPAIVRSAVLYCFRCLIAEDIPLNDGVLAPVTIRIPSDCLLNPRAHEDPELCAAVGGGNVETSQRIVDVVFGALNVVAASQGTMNNFLFGRAAVDGRPGFGYYETICGGAGAGPGFAGASAVHTHMTNTRITDPEVLEDRYPVRLRCFRIRAGSGGAGRYQGGDGVVREIEFLEEVELSLVTNRRKHGPPGANGGKPGSPGSNLLYEPGESDPIDLGPFVQQRVPAGSILRIETPGGGGWGE